MPPLALYSIYLGLIDDRHRHRAVAWWAFPIWLYVSITGVVVYLLLYQIFPPRSEEPKMVESPTAAISADAIVRPGSVIRE